MKRYSIKELTGMPQDRNQLYNYKDQVGDRDRNVFDDIDVIARFRGLQCGCDYAEAFVTAQHAYRMTAKRILP